MLRNGIQILVVLLLIAGPAAAQEMRPATLPVTADVGFTSVRAKMRYSNGIGPATPIMQLILSIMSLEPFTYALCDRPKEIHGLMELIDEKNAEAYALLARADADWQVVRGPEDLSSLLVSPGMFERYALPSLSRYAGICHEAGKQYMVHTCGHVRDFLEMFRVSGIDALHYLTGPPTGNTPLREAREAWKDDVTVMAAIDPLLLVRATPEEVGRHVLEMLKTARPGRSFMVMSSSKPDVPEANLRAVARTMKEAAKYPPA